MKSHVYLITFLILFKSTSLVAGYGLGARFVEFWKYVFNKDEELDRQKRITLDEESDGGPQLPPDKNSQYSHENSITQSKERFARAEEPNLLNNAVGWMSEKPIDNDSNEERSINKQNVLFERSSEIDNNEVIGDATHTVRTVSITQVPFDESSGEDDQTASGERTASGEVTSGSVTLDNSEDTSRNQVLSWPRGTYGLPKPKDGCPDPSWKTGFRFHDTEDDGTENQHSDTLHLSGNFTDDGIRHEFCIKTNEEGEGDWPEGKYCIYKKGKKCPNNLSVGFVIWDDENNDNQNDKGGELPDGQYAEDTKIYFCCYTTGDTETKIHLPNEKPFFLFAYQSIKCQRVSGMKVTSEFIKFDDEDRGNIDYEGGDYPYGTHKAQKDHMLFLCYYEPYHQVTRAARYKKVAQRESVNLLQVPQETALANERAQEEADKEQESLEKSEEMMRAFLKDAGGEDEETNKSERTRTIIKTIRIPGKSKSYTTAIIIGLVLSGVVVSTAIILIAKYVISRTNIKQVKAERVETTWRQRNADQEEIENARSEDEMSMIETDFDDLEDEDELVEDQLLPDSELKSGLELMFLKQQRHYWRQKPDGKYQ